MGTSLDALNAPQSLTQRRHAASNLPNFELPPVNNLHFAHIIESEVSTALWTLPIQHCGSKSGEPSNSSFKFGLGEQCILRRECYRDHTEQRRCTCPALYPNFLPARIDTWIPHRSHSSAMGSFSLPSSFDVLAWRTFVDAQ